MGEQVNARSQTARLHGLPMAPAIRAGGLKNSRYFMYMIRELTAVFAALWVVLFLAQIASNGRDPRAWTVALSSPGWLVFSVIAFIFVMYHAWTAFTASAR